MENNKTRTILTIAVLGVFLAAFTLWTVFKPTDAASDAERRSLAQLPALTSQSLLSGTFADRFEEYATDQFPLRDEGCCVSGIITACTGWEIIWPSWNTP